MACLLTYEGGLWEWVHIDDVRPAKSNRPEICSLIGLDMPSVFNTSGEDIEISADQLMKDSLHPAASRIEDVDQMSNRTTDRIAILHSAMNPRTHRVHQGIESDLIYLMLKSKLIHFRVSLLYLTYF